MFCRIKDVNTFTCNICFSKMCVYLCFSTPYISLYTVAVLMHKQRWASGGKIWKRETLGAVWLSEWPILLEHRRDASLHQTHQRAENLSRHFSLSFWPSSLHYAVCFFMSVYITHSLPLHAPIFCSPARCCEPGFLPSILPPLWVCIGGETHLPTRNDIIVLLGSQSDGSTWSPAFRGALCTQERQRGEGGGKESLKWISGQTEAYTGTEG